MKQRVVVAWMGLVALWAGAAARAEAPPGVSWVPAEAVGFLCTPDVSKADQGYKGLLEAFDLQAGMQPPAGSLVDMIKQYLQLHDGFDPQGPLCVLAMPSPQAGAAEGQSSGMPVPPAPVMLLPATDPQALLRSMGGQVGEGQAWNVTVMGAPSAAIAKDKYIIVAQTPDVAQKVAASTATIDGKLAPEELAAMTGMNVILWLDGDRLLRQYKDIIMAPIGMGLMMSSNGNPDVAQQMQAVTEGFDTFIEGARSGLVGVGVSPAGILLRMTLLCKPGSELAAITRQTTTSGPMLQGLPALNYLAAFSALDDEESVRRDIEDLQKTFDMLKQDESVNKEKVDELYQLLKEWAPLAAGGGRLSFHALPAGPAGLIGAVMISDASDSQKFLEMMPRVVEVAKQIPTGGDFKQFADVLTYQPDAEKIGGAAVHHLKLDLAKLEDFEEDLDDLMQVIGKDGLLLRLAAAGPKKVIAVFGGGTEFAAKALEQAGSDGSPLEALPGIQKVSKQLPKNRSAVFYVAVDEILALVHTVAKLVEEEDAFADLMPKIDAPLAVSATGGENWAQIDVHCPHELLVHGRKAVVKLMGMQGAPPTAAPSPADAEQAPAAKEE